MTSSCFVTAEDSMVLAWPDPNPFGRGFAGHDDDREHELRVAFRRHEPTQKIDELAREKRVARNITEPETPSFDDGDVAKPHVEELLEQHWTRQRPRQSTRQRYRAPKDLLGERLREHQVADDNPTAGPQHAQGLGKDPALACRKVENTVRDDHVYGFVRER